jgi:two-component system response regulator
LHVLLVEDDPGHLRLVEIAFREIRSDVHVVTARDGEEALELLLQESMGNFDLVLLDLNLPRLCGEGVLSALQERVEVLDVPIIVLSSTANPVEIRGALELGASGFVTKPDDYGSFLATLRGLDAFWLGERDR